VTWSLTAGLLAAVATAAALSSGAPRGPRSAPGLGGAPSVRPPRRPRVPGGPAAAGVVTAVGVAAGVPVLLLPTAVLLTWAATTLAIRARRDTEAVGRRTRVVDACEAMLGELHAGQPPLRALDRASSAWPALVPVARAARLDGDVPSALRAVSTSPGAGALQRLADAWQLCAASGSGLASALEQVLSTVRVEHEVVLTVRSELASARATARLLAVLPVIVLVMAQGIGAHPWRFLLATVPGQLCLGLGVGLAVVGVMWLERIADDVQGRRR
jgi:tight adherence protein B